MLSAYPRNVNPENTPSIGVALGGGSARGYAHIGALAVLERHDLAPSVLVGTSFGAVVGAMYAIRRTPEELERHAAALRRRHVLPAVVDFGLHRGALFAGNNLEDYFDRLVEGRHFQDLERPLVVTATDLDSGDSVLINEGPLAPALRASASLPGVFAPVEYQGRRLMDGGIGAPAPLETLDGFDVDLKIGIGAGSNAVDSSAIRAVQHAMQHPLGQRLHGLMKGVGNGRIRSLMRALAWTAESYLRDAQRDGVHVDTRPPIHWLRFDRAELAIRAGERALEGALPALRAALAAPRLLPV